MSGEENYLTYNIGDKFWQVSIVPLWNSEKIKMIDADGMEWYRYPNGRHKYEINELEIIGRLFFRIEGEGSIWAEEDYVGRYAVRVNGKGLDEVFQEDLDNERYSTFFRSREEAEAYVAQKKAEE